MHLVFVDMGLNNLENDQEALEFAVAASALKHTIYGDFNRVTINDVKNLLDGNLSGRSPKIGSYRAMNFFRKTGLLLVSDLAFTASECCSFADKLRNKIYFLLVGPGFSENGSFIVFCISTDR